MATHLGGGGEVQGAALAVQAHRHPKLTGQSGSPRTAVTWPALELKITPQPTPQYGQVSACRSQPRHHPFDFSITESY